MATKKKKPTLEKKSKKSPKLEIKEEPKQDDSKKENKILKAFLITLGIIILISLVIFLVISKGGNYKYKSLNFEAKNYGTKSNPIIWYETLDLEISNDGTNSPFGFRISTKPSKLEDIPFENLENFELMKINGFTIGNNTFKCGGEAIIGMENLKRLYSKMGMSFNVYANDTCDSEGRYNFFYLNYGDKTEIKELSPKCYEIVIAGDENDCEILKGLEKLMVEMYIKYSEI